MKNVVLYLKVPAMIFILLSLDFAENFQKFSAFFFGKTYPSFFQVFSKCSEKPNCSKQPCNRSIIPSLIYQGLNYQIIDVIQLNRAKFISNRSKKKTRMLRQ